MHDNFIKYLSSDRNFENEFISDKDWDWYVEILKEAFQKVFPSLSIPNVLLVGSMESNSEFLSSGYETLSVIDINSQKYFDSLINFMGLGTLVQESYKSNLCQYLQSRYVCSGNYEEALFLELFINKLRERESKESSEFYKFCYSKWEESIIDKEYLNHLKNVYGDFIHANDYMVNYKIENSNYFNFQNISPFQNLFIIAHEMAHHAMHLTDTPELKKRRKEFLKFAHYILLEREYLNQFIELWEIDKYWLDDSVFQLSLTTTEESLVDSMAITFCLLSLDKFVDKFSYPKSIVTYEDKIHKLRLFLYQAILQTILSLKNKRIVELLMSTYKEKDNDIDYEEMDFQLLEIAKEFFGRYVYANDKLCSDIFDDDPPKVELEDSHTAIEYADYLAQQNMRILDDSIKQLIPKFIIDIYKFKEYINVEHKISFQNIFEHLYTETRTDSNVNYGNKYFIDILKKKCTLSEFESDYLNLIKRTFNNLYEKET